MVASLRTSMLASLLLASAAACSPEPGAESNAAAALPANATAQPADAAAPANQAAPALAIESGGLRLFDRSTGSARPLPFGTPQSAVIAALAHLGRPETNRLEECGAGPLDAASWPGGPTLYFQDSKFAGWALRDGDNAAITTASGIGIGSTRAELDAAYQAEVFDSSLGTEFSAGELFGILDGTGQSAKITNLWAGASCNMR